MLRFLLPLDARLVRVYYSAVHVAVAVCSSQPDTVIRNGWTHRADLRHRSLHTASLFCIVLRRKIGYV